VTGVGDGEGYGEGDGEDEGEACGCGSPVCAPEPENRTALSHKKAQKAQTILQNHFVLFVPFCGLIFSSRRLLVSVLR
jgi:hypothetical protein